MRWYRERPRPEGLGFFGSREGLPIPLLGGAALIGGIGGLFTGATAVERLGSLAAVGIGGLVTAWVCVYFSRPPVERD